MTDIRKILNIISESSAGASTAGAVASVPSSFTSTQSRVQETTKAPDVLEYGNWENSAASTSNKLKKSREKSAKVVKSIYGDDKQSTTSQEVSESARSWMKQCRQQYGSDVRFFSNSDSANESILAKKNGKIVESFNGNLNHSVTTEQSVAEGKTGPGLWANIHAKRERIKSGSGERMRKSGSKGAPTAANFKAAASESVTEEFDSEALADEIYNAFETMYPNLARRADERVVHDAIIDVLNYGGGDPGALAQDVARAVKRSMQGVTEGAEVKIPTADGITMQDIRLMAGEGKLTKKTVLQAIAIIRKQREERAVTEGDFDQWGGEIKTPTGKKQKYEMMLSNGKVKKFVASNDREAKSIAKGHGAKSVIKIKGNVPAGSVSEGWKDKVAGAALGAAALGGIGLGITNSPMAHIDGKQIHMAMPGKIPDNAKLVTDDDGKKIYVWRSYPIKNSPGNTKGHLVYRPAEDVKEDVVEGLGKDIKRLATGKDVKSRAGQEIAKSQDASMKGDNKTANKHFKRYDKLDKLANKGVAEGTSYNIDQDDLDDFTPDEIERIKNAHFPDTLRDNLRAAKKQKANQDHLDKLKGSSDGSDSKHISPVGNSSDNTYEGVTEGLEDKVIYQGKAIGHIEHDSDGDPVGIVYSNNPQSKRPWEIYGYTDINQLKKEMLSQYFHRVPQCQQGVAEGLNESLSSMVDQDQAERNEYATFVKSQAGGDWSKGGTMYAQLKNRPKDDIFGDVSRLDQFMKMKFNFNKFTNKDWDDYWLLAQHCDKNRDFQKNALSIIKKYQGTDHSHYKYLYDRISMGLTGKQKYGTQNVKEQGVAEGLIGTQKKIEDTILKLEQRLKFAKTPEQWDNIKNRIDRLQAGLNRSKQGVAEAKFEYKPYLSSDITDPEEYKRWRDQREIESVFGDTPQHIRRARGGMYKKSIATPRQWKMLFDLTDEQGRFLPRMSKGHATGVADKKAGKDINSNPFTPGSDEHRDWVGGWKSINETNDYFRRREREEGIISGQKPARKKQPARTSDYAKRREKENKKSSIGQGIEEGQHNLQPTQLDELSTEKLSQYKKAASADATIADRRGDFNRGNKRFSGIVKATNKQFANDAKNNKPDEKLDENDIIVSPHAIEKMYNDLMSKTSGREDHEVQMAKGDLVNAGKNAVEIYQHIRDVSEEDGLEGWVQEKIIKATDYLNTVKNYFDSKQIESIDGVTPGTHMFTSESVDSSKDTVEMDIPFLIRALEYAREDAKEDVDLHNVVEHMIDAAMKGKTLTMQDYAAIFGSNQTSKKN